MSASLSPTEFRSLRIGIDGREMEGRPTGVGRYLRSLVRRFATHPRHRFVIYGSAPITLPVEALNLTTRVLSLSHPFAWEQRRLPVALGEDGIDVLMSPAYSCPLLTTVPRVTAIHDLSFFARPREFPFLHGLRRRIMARLSARVSNRLLACSQFTRAEIERHLGAAAGLRTRVVALGPDDDLPLGPGRPAAREALGLPDDAPYLLTVGTVLRRRNVSTLVRALARLRMSHPTVRLGIVGENRSHPFEDVAALARALGLEDVVRLSGFVSDEEIARHYASADVAVFLSEYEGFGLPALEAMCRGLPTVIADRGSLNEMFAAGAMVVEPDENAVAAALGQVIESPGLKTDLRRRGLERAKAFSWERAAAETLQVLEEASS